MFLIFFHARARGFPTWPGGGGYYDLKLGLHPSIPRGTLAIPRGTLAGEWRHFHELRGPHANCVGFTPS